MAISEKAIRILAKDHQIPVEKLMEVMRSEMEGVADTSQTLHVPFRIGTTMYRSMNHASRFFREVRDNGVFFAGKCPRCGRKVFPPQRPVCLACIKKGILSEYEYLELGPEVFGVCEAWSQLLRGTSKQGDQFNLYPSYVKVDGCANAHWQFIYPVEGKQISIGAKVRSVLRPQDERTGQISDFWFVLD